MQYNTESDAETRIRLSVKSVSSLLYSNYIRRKSNFVYDNRKIANPQNVYFVCTCGKGEEGGVVYAVAITGGVILCI